MYCLCNFLKIHSYPHCSPYRFAIDTMQSLCLDEFGGERVVPPSTQETTIIQHIFGGHLQSQVILQQSVSFLAIFFPMHIYCFLQIASACSRPELQKEGKIKSRSDTILDLVFQHFWTLLMFCLSCLTPLLFPFYDPHFSSHQNAIL